MAVSVDLTSLRKTYGETIAIDNVNLSIKAGELFFLLGPSGCGKTTLLRLIAGFIEPDQGEILFGERDVTQVPPHQRNTGMVFQNYALWPHLSVAENVAYGLRVRKVSRAEREERVQAALRTVRMERFADRRPEQLSGGQQQRVALARAMAFEPDVLLLDEPLSNLDAKLRLEMREEIRRIHAETGFTVIYVTHDQKESLSLASRIALLVDGRVVQTGTPREIYAHPRNRFVADFLGEANFVPGQVTERDGGRYKVKTPIGELTGMAPDAAFAKGEEVLALIRPEAFQFNPEADLNGNRFQCHVIAETYLGEMEHVKLRAGEIQLLAYRLNPRETALREDAVWGGTASPYAGPGSSASPSAPVEVGVPVEDVTLLPSQ